MQFNNSEDLCRHIREEHGDTIMLSFSCGKDSLAAWIQCSRYFDRIVPFFLYLVPGLEFIEDNLRYYEDVFQTHIVRLPHPSMYRWLNNFVFQAPENLAVVEEFGLPEFDYEDIYDLVRYDYGLPDDTYTALGVIAYDSPNRWAAIKKYGPMNEKRQTFYPVYDWKKTRLMSEINMAGVKLSTEYHLFGRSFDGLDFRFLSRIQEQFPRDFARIREFFPLSDIDTFRIQCRQRYYERLGALCPK